MDKVKFCNLIVATFITGLFWTDNQKGTQPKEANAASKANSIPFHGNNDRYNKIESYVNYLQNQNSQSNSQEHKTYPAVEYSKFIQQPMQEYESQHNQMDDENPSNSNEQQNDDDEQRNVENPKFETYQTLRYIPNRAINHDERDKLDNSVIQDKYQTQTKQLDLNIEPVYHESQTVYRENKPDQTKDKEEISAIQNSSTAAYDQNHLYANSTAQIQLWTEIF